MKQKKKIAVKYTIEITIDQSKRKIKLKQEVNKKI